MSEDGKKGTPAKDRSAESLPDYWRLETLYPDVHALLRPAKVGLGNKNAIFVLDTNVLLLPFNMGGTEFSAIVEVYKALIDEGRLYVPARVLREYIANRDSKLAELVKTIKDQSSAIRVDGAKMPAFLSDSDYATTLGAIKDSLGKDAAKYKKEVRALVERISAWRGDDPVTAQYLDLFRGDVVVEVEREREILAAEWRDRCEKKIPPGFKDANKPDSGIGDFLIWRTILQLAEKRKDLVFVSADEKGDWHVRCDGGGLYPRPELVAEYRKESNGKMFEITTMADILRQRNLPDEVVQEVREAEQAQELSASSIDSRTDSISKPSIFWGGSDYVVRRKTRRHLGEQYHVELDLAMEDPVEGIPLSDGGVLELGFVELEAGVSVVPKLGASITGFSVKGTKNFPASLHLAFGDITLEVTELGVRDEFLVCQAGLQPMLGRVLYIGRPSMTNPNGCIGLQLRPMLVPWAEGRVSQ